MVKDRSADANTASITKVSQTNHIGMKDIIIIQYLLIFISLIALYLFVSDMNKSEAFAVSQERMSKRVDTLKDSITQLVVEQTDNAYFSLAVNRDAQQAHPDFSPEELQIIIEDYILLSHDNPKGSPKVHFSEISARWAARPRWAVRLF